MTTPSPYLWTFDKNPCDKMEGATRFSVGIYQWLPKTSGMGLKRSKSLRVNGYQVEADRVYGKATLICNKLNKEKVKANQLPDWVQKHYSIPKPPGLEVPRFWDHLKGSQLRAIRLRVMKDILLPNGFIKGKEGSTYVREVGNQIHLVNFQSIGYGQEYAVNLGFHYDFVPKMSPDSVKNSVLDFHLLDCCLYNRLSIKGKNSWPYTYSKDACKKNLIVIGEGCLEKFKLLAHDWNDPSCFLDVFPPSLISQIKWGHFSLTKKADDCDPRINSMLPWCNGAQLLCFLS